MFLVFVQLSVRAELQLFFFIKYSISNITHFFHKRLSSSRLGFPLFFGEEYFALIRECLCLNKRHQSFYRKWCAGSDSFALATKILHILSYCRYLDTCTTSVSKMLSQNRVTLIVINIWFICLCELNLFVAKEFYSYKNAPWKPCIIKEHSIS